MGGAYVLGMGGAYVLGVGRVSIGIGWGMHWNWLGHALGVGESVPSLKQLLFINLSLSLIHLVIVYPYVLGNTYIHTDIHTYIHTYIYVYVYVYRMSCQLPYLTYVHN